jgi:hypothetical protein
MHPKTSIIVVFILSIVSICLIANYTSTRAAESETGEGPAVVEHETGFYYTVQKGDTLWDLSQQFSNSPWQWTELWQENQQIVNPHRIYPGERIRLYRRKGGHRYGTEDTEKDAGAKAEFAPGSIAYYFSAIDNVGFIRKQPAEPHGTIYKVREAKEMIYEQDIVYIKPEGDAVLAPGSKYTIYRTLKPIRASYSNAYIGIQHYLTGLVEIIQQEEQFAIGKVLKSYRPILLNDKIMPYHRRAQRIAVQKSQAGILGRIIEGEEHQTMIGDTTIAFIDKGKQDGIKPGQFYSLYYQDEHRVKMEFGKQTILTPVDFGELLVVHIEDTTSTVLITRTEKEIAAGAMIRTPLQ